MLVFMGVSMVLARGGVVEKLRARRGDGRSDATPRMTSRTRSPTTPSSPGSSRRLQPLLFPLVGHAGAALTLNALELGLAVLVVFAVLHWSIDLGWDVFLAYTVHKSRALWNDRVFVAVFAFCGGVMVIFGIWFGATAVMMLLS